MKFFLPAVIFLLIYFNAASQVTFQKVLRHLSPGTNNCLLENPDRSIVLSGTKGLLPNTKSFLIKTNANGDTLWTHLYYDSIPGYGAFLAKAFDGYVLTGSRYNIGSYILKTDSLGNLIWAKEISGGFPEVRSIIELSDSGILITGDFNSTTQDIFMIKFNSFGDTIWSKGYGGVGTDYVQSIDRTNDGGVIIGGFTDSFNFSDMYYLIKINVVGTVEWSRTFENINGVAYCRAVSRTFDGGCIIAGSQGIVKVDSSGNMEWQKNYNSIFGILMKSITQSIDSGFIITGFTTDSLATESSFILKTDPMGNFQWCRAINQGESFLELDRNPVLQSRDSGFITTGMRHIPFNSSGINLIKTDHNGNSYCNQYNIPTTLLSSNLQQNNVTTIEYPTSFSVNSIILSTGHLDSVITLCSSLTFNEELNDWNNQFSIFPNPADDQFTIWSSNMSINKVQIYNLWGQPVYSSHLNPNNENHTINCEHFPKGIYFVKAISNSGSVIKKFVVQ